MRWRGAFFLGPNSTALNRTGISDFLAPDGVVNDLCHGPCYPLDFTGP